MKILFWNIGKELNDSKLDIVKSVITSNTADIICLAEGSYSKENCKKLDDYFSSINYFCYYSPLFVENKSVLLDYKFERLGLKIYLKDNSILDEDFHFGLQRENGRIISLTINKENKRYIFVFVHNYSKAGNRTITTEQTAFITRLSDMIKFWKIKEKRELLLILGDFNLEPWDNILREKKLLDSFFITKHWNYSQRIDNNTKSFFNPLLENIVYEQNPNLGGTFYKNDSGWALFDYVLVNGNKDTVKYKILTENLLEGNISKTTDFIKHNLDHLPILTEINN